MGMVVRTNTMAINAYRQLGMNNSAVAKSLEKLASGYRINRAGDDAAGLAISEKMKAQITGLETASANAQDGISLIQTAEGNLNEVHDMLNRMVELATKSANGTYTSTERSALQDEVNQLLQEIDRISQSANFNGTNLLDGTMGLNTDAITIGKQVAGEQGKAIDLAVPDAIAKGGAAVTDGGDIADGKYFPPEVTDDKATYPTYAYHETEPASPVVAPKFSINLDGLKMKTGTGDSAASTITIGGGKATITLTTGTTAVATGSETLTVADGVVTVNLARGHEYTGADIAAIIAKGLVGTAGATDTLKIDSNTAANNFYYKATASGSELKFEAVKYGATAANDIKNMDSTLAVEGNGPTLGANGTGLVKFAAGNSGNSMEGDLISHDMYEVVNPKAAVTGGRAGINFKLDEKIVADGNRLSIDGKTFVFKTDAKSDVKAGDGEILIDVSDKALNTDALKIAEAVDKMSHYQTANFKILANGNSQIHIEQLESSEESYDYDKLVAQFAARGADTGMGTKVSIEASKLKDGDKLLVDGKAYTFVAKATGAANEVVIADKATDTVANFTKALKANNIDAKDDGMTVTIRGSLDKAPEVTGAGLTLQIGDTADNFNKMNVQVANMSAEALGLKDLSILTEGSSSDAIARVKTAINSVSTARAGMGALQNRLEHTINNLDVAAENLSAANSRIRDTDMAKEMMNYTKMNVLVQSAQAMLAQANQQPQSVLQLLQ